MGVPPGQALSVGSRLEGWQHGRDGSVGDGKPLCLCRSGFAQLGCVHRSRSARLAFPSLALRTLLAVALDGLV